jgi:hypothetical protein
MYQKNKLIETLNNIQCCHKNLNGTSWNWFWQSECDALHFESLDSYRKNAEHPIRLGTLVIRGDALYINLPSFKRACLAIPLFHRLIESNIARVHHADFINKVFGIDDRLPHGYSELFNEDKLEDHIHQRLTDYNKIQSQCENADTAEEAFKILADYTKSESQKKLPYTERYAFLYDVTNDIDNIFLGFYIFLRGRELVAIRRWFGDTSYTLANAAEDTIEKVFGGINTDIIE